jgi:hypothetical protein
MNLITPKSQLERDLADKEAAVIRSARGFHSLAATLRAENQRFWSLPPDRLLAVLNHNVEQTLATFTANTMAGQAINAVLDAVNLPGLTGRAPVSIGREGIAFDEENGVFTYTAPPEPEPEPEPDPEP